MARWILEKVGGSLILGKVFSYEKVDKFFIIRR